MKVVNTQKWTFDQLAPYGTAITAAMKKLEEKFPDDVTVESLAQECMNGTHVLWLILDDDDKFVSFAMVNVKTIDATGKKVGTLVNMAGEQGLSIADAMCEAIHAWCDEQGCDITAYIGTRAWLRALKKHGYTEYAVIARRKAR